MWEQIPGVPAGITAFLLTRKGKQYAVLWHNTGSGRLSVPLGDAQIGYTDTLGGAEIPTEREGQNRILPVAGKRYLVTDLPKAALAAALAAAVLTEA